MSDEIFSPEGLTRLRTPEQIDTLFIVTKPVFWMALATLGVLVASLAMWSIFGAMSTTVNGVGILVDSGGVVNVIHDSNGRVTEVLVRPGGRVRKGEAIARVAQPLLDSSIIIERESIQRSSNLQEVLRNQSSLNTSATQKEIGGTVLSTTDGIVSEIQVNVGDYITAGVSPICTIRKDYLRGDLTAVMYFPVGEAKKIAPGMVAQLVPSEADGKTDGYLLGIVRVVSDYPSSTAGISRLVGNADLAAWLQNQVGGASLEVIVDPIESGDSPSGYLWTSIVGHPPKPGVGSYCSGKVVVEKQAPLERLFYRMGEWLRVF